ncbi:MAG: SDR family oxidoreductase [Myxococcota bacterium]|nr:SDR family oxidoreductase [Myxococcota bacterium]
MRALILGASSGFGAAAAVAFAEAGWDVAGVHLDRRATLPQAEAVVAKIEAAGQRAEFFNVNAADDGKRAEVLEALAASGGGVDVLMHSLAFGSLRPFVDLEGGRELSSKQLTMTMEVMAHSLLWWSRDLVHKGLMGRGGRIFAMSSSGSLAAMPHYGAVSAAKCALESHIRQLAVELAPAGICANTLMAGVTDTPALRKIPGHEQLMEHALARNPQGRLTTVDDLAGAIVALSSPALGWMTGNVLRIDGGETISG